MSKIIFRLFRRLFLVCTASVLALLGVTPFYLYEQFNQETPVARLSFEKIADYHYIAQLQQGDFCSSQQYSILGDQFQLDAGFVKWKGLAVFLGFTPRYRLDRLSGRYSDLALQNNQETLSNNLAPDVMFDFFDENIAEGSSGWLMDTSYGSSVYLSIDPTQRYTVYATEDGLFTRAESAQEFIRKNGELQIDISQGCVGEKSIIAGLSESLNSLATSAIR